MKDSVSEPPPWTATGKIGRRRFLKLGGAGLAATTLAVGGIAGIRRPLAQNVMGPLRRAFEAAASAYAVPVEVLLAMGYVNTRWEMPPPETNAYEPGEARGRGSFGIMALISNPSADTLGTASALTGISEALLKTDSASNIMGGAALLAEASGVGVRAVERGITTGPVQVAADLNRSLEAVRYGAGGGRAVAGVGAGDLYAEQVRDTLRVGVSATISSGERITLAPAGR